jgi:hypothetical protein
MKKSKIYLFDCSDKKLVEAFLYDEIKQRHANDANINWKNFLSDAAKLQNILKSSEQSAHWDWDKKMLNVTGQLIYQTFAIECNGSTQGLMIINNAGKICKLDSQKGKPLVYIEFIETAPWNRPQLGEQRYKGIGTTMVAAAIKASLDFGFEGRIGLHSLPQSEDFYIEKCGMTDLGQDTNYHGKLHYMEMNPDKAKLFMGR